MTLIHTHKPPPLWRRWLQALLGTAPTEPSHLRTGIWGEEQAARSLSAAGLTVLGRRVRVGRRDEIDLLAREGETLVFVEVKTRRSTAYGRPGEAVDRSKRRRLSRAAMRYMKALRARPARFRFDVVEVVGDPEGGLRECRHLRNAFPLQRPLHVPW